MSEGLASPTLLDQEAAGTRRRSSRRRRAQEPQLSSAKRRATLVVLGVSTLGSALALGAVHPTITLLLCFVLLAGSVYLASSRRARFALPLPALVLAGLGAFCLLQSLPAPRWLLAALAPANLEVWSGAYDVLGKPVPTWLPISLDPSASRLEALKWLAYAQAFALAAQLGGRLRLHLGAVIVFASAVVVALVTLAHRLVDAERVYGFYVPVGEFARTSIGPLLNPNNLAGYLNLGIFCGIGLMLTAPVRAGADDSPEPSAPPLPRWLSALGTAALFGASVETGSRGGILALAVGLLALAPLALGSQKFQPRVLQRRRAGLLAVAGVVVFGLVLALLAFSPRMLNGAEDTSFKKLAMTGWVMPLISDHRWLGVGRGAFESAFQAYRIGENNLIYSHPENLLLQWASEWGLPVSLLGVVALGWLLRPRALGARSSPIALCSLLGAGVLVLQNAVDLGLEVPALAVAALVAVGWCWGHFSLAAEPGQRARTLATYGVLGVAAALFVGVVATGFESVGDARRRLEGHLESIDPKLPADVASFRGSLAGALLGHPADPYFPRLAALAALRAQDQSPLPWINRSLELGVTSGRSHYLLGRMLLSHRRYDQAFLELRYAVGYDPQLVGRVADLALGVTHDRQQLSRLAPEGQIGGRMMLALARRLKHEEDAALRLDVLRDAVRVAPDLAEARTHLADELLSALARPESTLCRDAARPACVQEVEASGAALRRLSAKTADGAQILARLYLLQGELAKADTLLLAECPRVEVRRSCLMLHLEIVAKLRDSKRTQGLAHLAAAQSCVGIDDCARLAGSIAEVLSKGNELGLALNYALQAAREERSDARWLRVAELASALGRHGLAVEALSTVQKRRGRADAALRRQIDLERAKAAEEDVGRQLRGQKAP